MSNLVNELSRYLNDDVIKQLTTQVGADNPNQVKQATQGIADLLLEAISREAQTSGENLYGAIQRDHDGGILSDIMGVLTGQKQPVSSKTTDGTGILGHLLGKNQLEAAQVISQMSGLDLFKSGVLMQKIAPIVMGLLGQKQRSNNLDVGGLLDILGGGNRQPQTPVGGLLEKIIDRNGDGNMMDDLFSMGMNLLRK